MPTHDPRNVNGLIVPAHSVVDPARTYDSGLEMHERPLLEGRRILITGAGTGIGAGIMVQAALHRARVVGVHFDVEEHVSHAVDRLNRTGASIEMVHCDFRDEQQLQRLTSERLQGIDTVVMNAGITLCAPFLDTPLAAARHLFEVNFFSAWTLAQAAANVMRKNEISPETGRRGQLVFFTSPHARGAMGCHAAYASSKAAIENLAGHLAVEFNERGYEIRVNSVRPGWVLNEGAVRVLEKQKSGVPREDLIAELERGAPSYPGYAIFTPRSFGEALLWRIAIPGMHDHGSIWDLSGGQAAVFPGAAVLKGDACPPFGRQYIP